MFNYSIFPHDEEANANVCYIAEIPANYKFS